MKPKIVNSLEGAAIAIHNCCFQAMQNAITSPVLTAKKITYTHQRHLDLLAIECLPSNTTVSNVNPSMKVASSKNQNPLIWQSTLRLFQPWRKNNRNSFRMMKFHLETKLIDCTGGATNTIGKCLIPANFLDWN